MYVLSHLPHIFLYPHQKRPTLIPDKMNLEA